MEWHPIIGIVVLLFAGVYLKIVGLMGVRKIGNDLCHFKL
jgi:hypothetical protein